MISAGICIGASNIGVVVIKNTDAGVDVLESRSIPHEGNPRSLISSIFREVGIKKADYLAVTGRKFRTILNAPLVTEPEAVECSYRFLRSRGVQGDVIVSAGGETFMVYFLDKKGRIKEVKTGNKCASGTGEFFLQQLKRLDLKLDEAIEEAEGESSYRVSGRCSVFCKSDCTHALNKGEPKERIVAGLCEMMAEKILEQIKREEHNQVLLVGGASKNRVMVDFLSKSIGNLQVPDYADSFEALGAALWALEGKKKPASSANLFNPVQDSFSILPALGEQLNKVTYKEMDWQKAVKGDRCILGLDVGSTTTKAVLLREEDNALLAGSYLRTNGNPVAASRECYRQILNQVDEDISITGLGVTGSGRQIAGLHALTPAVINEIIAHATAAVFFDAGVDTLFEIGGQDAKYTYLTNGVPSDYAMNEACSAGTGSFLEESAGESLGIDVEDIGTYAIKSKKALNFSDQCAAFINSDIKTAIQEGAKAEDIAAGLVYSVCLNYSNRVKGNRAVGEKVFMQGGVCYNKAVPAAMASLTGKEIIVPPNPGLMGAFGVALEVKKRLELGLLKPARFDIRELAAREVIYKEPFTCRGGGEGCDRGCLISRIFLEGKTYPFGGACNKYVNLLQEDEQTHAGVDLVRLREDLVFKKYSTERAKNILPPNGKQVGISSSLLTATLYPLYYNFFTALGFEVVLGDVNLREGQDRKGAAYCFPVELAHGLAAGLVQKDPHIYFLPHVRALPVAGDGEVGTTCPFVQGEPYYLQTSFPEMKDKKIISPVLKMEKGYAQARGLFMDIGRDLDIDPTNIEEAFDLAISAQDDFHSECQQIGRDILQKLEDGFWDTGVVLFGRPYNAFSKNIHMGIPHKFSSRGYPVIPCDFLPLEEEEPFAGMYWASGQQILKGAKFVQKHPHLYGAFITNFSCGPDSFLSGYFREIMGRKPSLTLELDSHTADAGLDTRIEAFLDVIKNYIQVNMGLVPPSEDTIFRPARTFMQGKATWVEDSRGEMFPIEDERAHVVIPSMGGKGAHLLAACFRHVGVRATALPDPGEKEFKLGQSFASCKECLPFILTLGSLMDLVEKRTEAKSQETLVYFMPETSGPCRFGQYNVLMKQYINKKRIDNVAFLSLTSENSYAGFGNKLALRAWQAVIIHDVLQEVYSGILTLAKDREEALVVYEDVCRDIIYALEHESLLKLKKTLRAAAEKLRSIELTLPLENAAKIALVGEIYVRQDSFSLKDLVKRMANRSIVVQTAPIAEWLYYTDYILKEGITSAPYSPLFASIQGYFKRYIERDTKRIFAASGLYEFHMVDVEEIIANTQELISPKLTGEAILTTGTAITEIVEKVSGVISIGPFGCMPGRMAEAIIGKSLNHVKAQVARDKDFVKEVLAACPSLPFLAVETDGNQFTPVIEARLDAFCLQVKRMHDEIEGLRRKKSS